MFFKPTKTRIPPPVVIAPPLITGHASGSIQSGESYTRTLTAVTYNSAAPIWNLDANPSGATITDNEDGTSLVEWTAGEASATPYGFTVSVSDGARLSSVSWAVTVLEAAEAVLEVQELTLPASVNLTTGGYSDFIYYGPGFASNGTTPTAVKADIAETTIGAPTFLVEPVWGYLSNAGRIPFEWTDGSPEAVETVSAMKGSWIRRAGGQANRGISIPIEADTDDLRVAHVFLGTLSDSGSPTAAKLTVTLPGASDYVADIAAAGGTGFVDRVFEIKFKAAEAGNLVIKWENTLTTGGLSLRAIGIVADGGVAGLTSSAGIPFTVNVHELLESTITYTGLESEVSMTADPIPDGASFVSNGGLTGQFKYRPPVGANTSTISPTVFKAFSGDVELASLTAGYSVGAATAAPPVITIPNNPWTVTVGAANTQTITATGEAGIVLSAENLPGDSSFDPATGVLEWAGLLAGDVEGSPYSITITATDGAGRLSTATITVNASAGAGGSLSKTSSTEWDATDVRQSVNFTSVGTNTWQHVTKAGTTPFAEQFTQKTGGDADTFHTNLFPTETPADWYRSFARGVWISTWTNGDPTASRADFNAGLGASKAGSSIKIKPMIGTATRTVSLYIGYQATKVRVKVKVDGPSGKSNELADDVLETTGHVNCRIVYSAKGITATDRLVIEVIKEGGDTGQLLVTGVAVA